MSEAEARRVVVEALATHRVALVAFASKLRGRDPAHGAEDLYQDTVVRALTQLHNFKENTNVRSWLMQMMYNLFVSQYRVERRFNQCVRPVELDTPTEPGRCFHPAAPMEQNENFEALADIVCAGMEPRYEAVLCARARLGSCQEVADALRIPLSTVMSRLYRARQHAIKKLQEVA